jgi:hypothetical protein
MVKKISHFYPHVGAALSPHTGVARPYPLSLSLDLSQSLSHRSTRTRFLEASVALDGVVEGWVTVECKVALPPPPRRAAHGIRLHHQGGVLLLRRRCLISSPSSWPISSQSPSARVPPSGPPSSAASSCSSKLPLLGRRPLSLPSLISVLVHCARCRVPWHTDGSALLELTEDVQI